jgi:hypothetical protein
LSESSEKPLTQGQQAAGHRGSGSDVLIDEKVKIKCPKCAQFFRERAQNVRNGSQTNCRHCNRLITFDSSSEDRHIRRALTSARDVRIALETRPKTAGATQGAQ